MLQFPKSSRSPHGLGTSFLTGRGVMWWFPLPIPVDRPLPPQEMKPSAVQADACSVLSSICTSCLRLPAARSDNPGFIFMLRQRQERGRL